MKPRKPHTSLANACFVRTPSKAILDGHWKYEEWLGRLKHEFALRVLPSKINDALIASAKSASEEKLGHF